jgi:hypothetical protein
MKLFRPSEGARNTKPALGLFIIVLSLTLGGYLWVQSVEKLQKEKIAYLEGLSERLRSETVPLKFMILSREEGQIKARFKFYDLSGREVATIEKAWSGAELYVDMLLIPFSSESEKADRPDSWLALPYRIFTDSLPAASGTLLFETYDDRGFPGVLRGAAWKPKEEAVIKSAYARALKLASRGLPAADSKDGSYGSAVHEAAKVASFEPGVVYKVVCRVKGGVEILEE